MYKHALFDEGSWQGSGKVTFNMTPDILYFGTRWTCQHYDNNIHATQLVEIVAQDRITNHFTICKKSNATFQIILQNELLGTFQGQGVIDDSVIAWEFRKPGVFEGYEVYEKMQEDEYMLHAEYLSCDQARTIIHAKLWKRSFGIQEEEQKHEN